MSKVEPSGEEERNTDIKGALHANIFSPAKKLK